MFMPGTRRVFKAGVQLGIHCNGYIASEVGQVRLKDDYLLSQRHDLVVQVIDLRHQLRLQAYQVTLGSCALCWGFTATTGGRCHFP